MLFALGYVAGVGTCAFIATILAYFRRPLIQALGQAETTLSNAGPRPRGFIYEPESEAETARKRHIAKNAAQGKDTPISELL